jgi:predicted Zn-dependent protease
VVVTNPPPAKPAPTPPAEVAPKPASEAGQPSAPVAQPAVAASAPGAVSVALPPKAETAEPEPEAAKPAATKPEASKPTASKPEAPATAAAQAASAAAAENEVGGGGQAALAAARKKLADDDPQGAETLLRQVLTKYPQDHHAMELLVHALMDQDRGAEALPYARKIVQRRPRRVSYRLLLGDLLLMVGDAPAARAEWLEASTIAPGDPQVKRRLGQ